MTRLPATLDLDAGGLRLDGTASILLCSSVFPFRIPRSQWGHRLQLVADSGYRMIDVYVHWGFHEELPGTIDLTSQERDLRHFLALARDHGLLVMARPGPYICSETDGGGLPWWLHGDAEGAPAALRTTDPEYLAAVDRWFAAVVPLLAEAQTTRGGPVALVQLENELDFFDCPDPEAYMAHLTRGARSHGIEVPIIACAGQGDLTGASGDVAGVVPTVNLYPDDASTAFDAEARHYAGVLEDRGLPLMVTETNRLHRTLRREILAGARLVAPYLQTSGFDHLVLPSAGNWGDPGNLMAHDYDFAGFISSDGRRRAEYDEAIALAATLEAWGEALATATPVPLDPVLLEGAAAGGALALQGGGHVVGPAEVDGGARRVRLQTAALGDSEVIEAVLAPGTCPFWALDVPLDLWGSEGVLAIATAELVGVERPSGPARGGTPLVLTFEGGPTARVDLVLPVLGGDAERLTVKGPGRLRSSLASAPVEVVLRERGPSRADPEPALEPLSGEMLPLPGVFDALGTVVPLDSSRRDVPGAEALALPDGRLRADLEISPEAAEVLLLGAADLVRLELDGTSRGVHVPYGAPLSVALASGAVHHLTVTSEIWGRANFDDARRPALALGAGRGIGTVLEVRGTQDVSDLWQVRRLPDRRGGEELAQPPLRRLGGWSSANPGAETTYARRISLPGRGDSAVLRLHGLSRPVHITVDGGRAQRIMPAAPIVHIESAGDHADVVVRAPHVPGGLVAGAELLTTARPKVRAVRTLREAELASALTRAAQDAGTRQWRPLPGVAVGRPPDECAMTGLRIAAEVPVLLRVQLPARSGGTGGAGTLLALEGTDVQVTVIAGARRVSRHVLGLPAISGGDEGRSWIPAGWDPTDADEVLLLVEALTEQGGIFWSVRGARTVR